MRKFPFLALLCIVCTVYPNCDQVEAKTKAQSDLEKLGARSKSLRNFLNCDSSSMLGVREEETEQNGNLHLATIMKDLGEFLILYAKGSE